MGLDIVRRSDLANSVRHEVVKSELSSSPSIMV
jgi:hypothetical protein